LEQTLLLIKPESILARIVLAILHFIKDRLDDVEIVDIRLVDSVEPDIIKAHYAEHSGKPKLYGMLLDYFVGKPIVVVILEGPNIVQRLRAICGDNDPSKAGPDTIRNVFCPAGECFELAEEEGRPTKSVVHVSKDAAAAASEVELWSKKYKMCRHRR
jgi:nucleoside-diphosphate kinase